MTKLMTLLCLSAACSATAQSFPSEYGEPGSTAIPKDSICFIGWATGGTLHKGFIDINDTTAIADGSNKPTYGTIDLAFGPAQGDIVHVVALGDSGYATLTFNHRIFDGPGFDFAVFENSFDDDYMELGHVEVSSDGVHFFRIPSTSEIPTAEQLGNFSYSDCGYVNNLAGKYKRGYGTPFDLSEIPGDALLDINAVTHIRIVDAIGAITGTGTADQHGTVINDPYPTPFPSGGFDLDAIGIINGTLSLDEHELAATVSPNPTTGTIYITAPGTAVISVYTLAGQLVTTFAHTENSELSFSELQVENGIYLLHLRTDAALSVKRIVFQSK